MLQNTAIMQPKVHLYCTLRNEARILLYFFRHYNQFVDRFFMYDDASDDGSQEIIRSESKAVLLHPPMSGLDDAMFANLHSTEYLWLSRGEADWVICVDADEFIYHRDILNYLKESDALGYKILLADGYQMVSRNFPTTDGQIYDEVRCGIFDDRYSKAVVFKPEIDLRYAPGRHAVTSETEVKHSDLKLLHFRYLSEAHMQAKHAANFARLSEGNRKFGYGGHNNPDYKGEYDHSWYLETLKEAKPINL